ncbi:MAG: DUF3857 domain-containing protein [Sediminibacterium sp.]|nr:DUF3857 domain-containing protein [Sediminibacterium sp.]
MRKYKFLLFFLVICYGNYLFGQEQTELIKTKFGKIKPEDFNLNLTTIDSNPNAVIIISKGQTYTTLHDRVVKLIYTRFERIKIMNKEGIKAAVFEIPVYFNKSRTGRLSKLKGYTYNLINNKVQTTEIKADNIFEEQTSKNYRTTKVSFPNVTEGSIVELFYETTSSYVYDIEPWSFQTAYPTLFSQYTVEIPMFIQFATFLSGTINLKSSIDYGNLSMPVVIPGLDTRTSIKKWEGFNIPALKIEPFISSVKNYQSKVSFQVSSFHFPGQPDELYNTTWEEVSKSLLDDERFGLFKNANNWLEPIVEKVISDPTTNKEFSAAEKIFNFVRDHFLCDGNGIFTKPYSSLKNIFESKKGNVADINLTLLAMLLKAKYTAFPIVLSTTNNGVIFQQQPNLERLNYVIVVVVDNDKYKFLDASQPFNGYGLLPAYCYNGQAIIIKKDEPLQFELNPQNNVQKSNVYISLLVDKEQNWVGSYTKNFNQEESAAVRQEIKSKSNALFQQELARQITKDNSAITIKNIKCNQIEVYEKPLELDAEMEIKKDSAAEIYINPLFGQDLNYQFNATKRQNPIEFGGLLDYTYELDLDIPHGYEIEDIPENQKIIFDNNQMVFLYKIVEEPNHLALEVKLQVNTPIILASRYSELLDFLALVNKKYKEFIVLKKNN